VPISGRSIGDSLVRDNDFGSPIARLELDCDTSCYLSPLCNLKKIIQSGKATNTCCVRHIDIYCAPPNDNPR